MLAPECAGALVGCLHDFWVFFESKEGRAVVVAFSVIHFIVIWLWRTGRRKHLKCASS